MEHISNETKAKEIAKNNRLNYIEGEIGWGATIVSSEEECYESALQALQWKDEQHAKEKESFFKEYRKEILNACIYDFEQKKTTMD